MDLSQLAVLQEKLVQAENFSEVWDYFMTHFAEQPGFMNHGDTVRHPVVEAAIAAAAMQVLGPQAKIDRMLLVRLPEQRFIHGAVTVKGRMANVFFFEEVGVGLLAVVMSWAGDNRMVRFTARTSPGGGFSRN